MKTLNLRNYTNKILCSAALILISTPSFAQLPDAAVTTANPSRVGQQLSNNNSVDASKRLNRKVEVRDLVLQETPAGSDNITLQLNSLNLDGVSAYDIAELQTLYADQIGQTITLTDVYAIATSLTNKYRNDGYILTQVIVPPQTIDGGNVQLQVIEGFVDQIAVEGGNDQGLDMIQYYASGIDTNKALNVKDLERHLLLINDLPGIEVRSVLSPSKTKTGAADLAIIVERDPYDIVVNADNLGSRFLGPLQLGAGGVLNSYFGNNERITAQIVAAPDIESSLGAELELGYIGLGYAQPLPFLGTGTVGEIFTSYTRTEPGFNLEELDVTGISRYVSAKISHPFIRSRSSNFTGYALVDWRDLESSSIIQDTLRDDIRAARIGGTYEFLDTTFGVGVNSVALEFSQGLNILGASEEGDLNLSRGEGDPKFSKVTADIQRLQRVTSDVNILVAATGQLSSGPLLSSEEFGIGGTNFGRGYDPSEIIGDDGFAAKFEIQWNEPQKVDFLNNYQIFGFVDGGRVYNDDATTGDQRTNSLTSTGFGIRSEFKNGTQGVDTRSKS